MRTFWLLGINAGIEAWGHTWPYISMMSHVARYVQKINSRENENKDFPRGSAVLLVSDLHLSLVNLYLFLNLCQVDVGPGILTIEYLGNFLEGRAFSLDKDEVDPDCLNEIPKLQTNMCIRE